MRIERVDDKTIKCFLSNEELEEYEISYKDFVLRNTKAREVIEDIIEQAEEEFGFRPPSYAFELQIMVLPDQGMILTFSEKSPEDIDPGKELMECLKQVKNILEQKRGKKEAVSGQQENESVQEAAHGDGANKKEDEKEEQKGSTIAMFSFARLRDVCNYAGMLPVDLDVLSILYELDGQYYLYLENKDGTYDKYSRACIQAMEFGALYGADEEKMEYVREHGACLIHEEALQKLRV